MKMHRWIWIATATLVALGIVGVPRLMAQAEKTQVVLWHAYRGDERKALEQVVETFNASHARIDVKLLAVPFDAFPDKITNAIPQGKGPDIFIFAHDRIGNWAESKVITPIDFWADDDVLERFMPQTMKPLTYRRKLYGLPMAFKSTVLFYNKDLIQTPPKTTDEMIALAKKFTNKETKSYGLVYEFANFYMHAAWFHGFGARVFDSDGNVTLNTPAAAASFQFAQDLRNKYGIVPQESTSVLVTSLFNEGKAAMVINGPWFRAELKEGLNYGVAPLPVVSATNQPARPFMGSEAVLMSAKSEHQEEAFTVMTYLTDVDAAVVRMNVGKQPVATAAAYASMTDPMIKVFREQLENSVPMPNTPQMLLVWSPVTNALNAVVTGGSPPARELAKAQEEIEKNIAAARR